MAVIERGGVLVGENEGEITTELMREVGLEATEQMLVQLRVQQLLGVAAGELRIVSNPTAPLGETTLSVQDVSLPVNGHDYI